MDQWDFLTISRAEPNSPFNPSESLGGDVLVAVDEVRVRADVTTAQHRGDGSGNGEPEDPAERGRHCQSRGMFAN